MTLHTLNSQLEASTNVAELQSFLVLCNIFRRFIPNFVRIFAPLGCKLRNDQLSRLEKLSGDEFTSLPILEENLIPYAVLFLL